MIFPESPLQLLSGSNDQIKTNRLNQWQILIHKLILFIYGFNSDDINWQKKDVSLLGFFQKQTRMI